MAVEQFEELVYRAQHNDAEAFRDIYKLSHSRVYHFAKGVLRHPHDAEDATQDVFIALFENINNIKKPAFLYSWLYTTTYRVCINLKRKYEPLTGYDDDIARLLEISEDNPFYIPEEAYEIYEFTEAILQFVNALPNEQQACIRSFYYQNLSVKEIAWLMCTNENTVKTRLHIGRKRIFSMILKNKKRIWLDNGNIEPGFKGEYPSQNRRYIKSSIISERPYIRYHFKYEDIYLLFSMPLYKVPTYISLKIWRRIDKHLHIL